MLLLHNYLGHMDLCKRRGLKKDVLNFPGGPDGLIFAIFPL